MHAGTATVDLIVPPGLPLAGNGGIGALARGTAYPLRARALVFAEGSTRVAVVVADLMSGTGALAAALAARRPDLPIVLAGTHTHHGPGGIFGTGFFAKFAAARPCTSAETVNLLADALAEAVRRAEEDLAPVTVSYGEVACWGIARNAARAAWARNPEANDLRECAPTNLSDARRAVDPRVRTLILDTARGRRVFATFGAHATALGPAFDHYHPDWPGLAADHVEASGIPWCGIAVGGAADTNVLATDTPQGPALAARVARELARAILAAVANATPLAAAHLAYAQEVVRIPTDLPWVVGECALGGAEDGRSALHTLGLVREGSTSRAFPPEHPQYPKKPALGLLQALARRTLTVPRALPVHRVSIGGACIVTAPGEITTIAARRLESLAGTGGAHVFPIGYTDEYAGYFTTPEEYAAQAYEGASTLFGRESLGWILDAHGRLAAIGRTAGAAWSSGGATAG